MNKRSQLILYGDVKVVYMVSLAMEVRYQLGVFMIFYLLPHEHLWWKAAKVQQTIWWIDTGLFLGTGEHFALSVSYYISTTSKVEFGL